MCARSKEPRILWSYWDKNNTVTWNYRNEDVLIELCFPPLSVSVLSGVSQVAIATAYEEDAGDNLRLYDFEGKLLSRISAPVIGEKPQICFVKELEDESVLAIVGFYKESKWNELAVPMDIESGCFQMEMKTRTY